MDLEMLRLVLAALGPTTACVVVTLRFIKFLENHMSKNTQAMTDTCEVLAGMKALVEECPRRTE